MALWWEEIWSARLEETEESTDQKSGLRRLAIASVTAFGLSLLTYVVPGLESFQPWVPGEPFPLFRLFTFTPPEGEPSIAEALPGAGLREDPDLLANLPKEDEEAAVETAPSPSEPTVEPQEYAGLVREIEDPTFSMKAFYEALYNTATGAHITRIVHFGDSTIAADDITSTVRIKLQKRFGDGGHGFVLVSKGTMPYRHRNVVHEGKGFKVFQIIHGALPNGRYGLGGAAAKASSDATAIFATSDKGPVGRSVSRFEIFYLAHPKGGSLEWVLDNGMPQVLSTKENSVVDRKFTITTEDGPHRLRLRVLGDGEVHLYGVVLERDSPGVVYDSLGMVGARAARLLNADEAHLASQLELRNPDLIILQFGGNEAGDRAMSMSWYERTLTEVVRRFRAARPNSSCLLMSPLDQGEVGPRGQVRTIPTVPKIVAVQRKVAFAQGCAFFDTFQAMGGEGSMYRWYKASPRLGFGDFRHATPLGYEVIGNMFYKALMKGFADYIARRPKRDGPKKEPVQSLPSP